MRENNSFRQRGHALIELIIVAPVLLSIAALGIEVSRFLRLNQVASILSQESANNTFRRCSDILDFENGTDTFSSANTQSAIQDCLNTELDGFRKSTGLLYSQLDLGSSPTFNLVLSVYRQDQGFGFADLTSIVVTSSANRTSNYYMSAGSIMRNGQTVLSSSQILDQGRVAIAEVTFEYTPIVPLYKIFLNLDILNTKLGQFRETTIL